MSKTLLVAFMLATAVIMPVEAASDFKHMSAEDFFLDRKSLLGQSVEVDAKFQTAGNTVFMVLADESNATFVDVDAVPREDRKSLYARCKGMCDATVRGVVKVVPGPIGSDVGIAAVSFSLKP